MNIKLLKKISVITGGVILGLYALFLILPFLFIPFLNTLTSKMGNEIENSTGFKTEFKKLRILTTPKLTLGAKLESAKIYEPTGDILFEGNDLRIKFSLLPLLTKKIEIDLIGGNEINLNLKLKPDGSFLLADYFKDDASENKTQTGSFELPFNFKFSNNLPDIKIKKHNIAFIDVKSGKNYIFEGEDTKITDFIFNKKIKAETEGKIVLDGYGAFKYDIKIFNKIMPDVDINEIISGSNGETLQNSNNSVQINLISIFNKIKNAKMSANLACDVKIENVSNSPRIFGTIVLDGVSLLAGGKSLPLSSVSLGFQGDDLKINSAVNTGESENTAIIGEIKSGNKKKIDLTCTSNAKLKSIFNIIKTVLNIFEINDFNTLNADGSIDVDFNLKSDFKKIISNGYLKLTGGKISLGSYNVKIDNIIADILLNNNSVLINKLGFSTLSIPFDITGKIDSQANADIKVNTDKLPLKELLVSLGQGAILKENPIYSGNVTVDANIGGKLTSPQITGGVSVNDLKVKNVPSDIVLSVNPVDITLESTKSGYKGVIKASGINAVNPAVTVSVPLLDGTIDENSVKFADTTGYIGKNELKISCLIKDYLKEKIGLELKTSGKIKSELTGNLNPYKMNLDFKFFIPESSEIIIPGFDKSELYTTGDLAISGSMTNPYLKGQFNVSSLEISEVPLSMKDLTVFLDGAILNGNITAKEFVSGGIKADEIKSDYKLADNVFYLQNLEGSAFDGKFKGDISYNLSDTKCGVKFTGSNMSALKAIEGAAGIKNALTGNLEFNADVNFKGVEYNDMMKTLKGSADFEIKDGVLANLGGLQTLLNAQNIISNSMLQASVQKVSGLSAVQQASEFDYIKGNLSFSGGSAILDEITMTGPLMAYYITGKYNLLSGALDAVVLGRLSGDTVSAMGSFGEFATGSFTSLISGFSTLTSKIAKLMNESPKNVNMEKIPALTSSAASTKEFKAVFAGNPVYSSSVKSFRWLNDVDTSEIDSNSSAAQSAAEAVNSAKNAVKDSVTAGKDAVKDTANQAKSLLKSLIKTDSSSNN